LRHDEYDRNLSSAKLYFLLKLRPTHPGQGNVQNQTTGLVNVAGRKETFRRCELARLLLRPLPTEAAGRNRQRLRRNAARKGHTPSAIAPLLAGYFCVLATLPEAVASDDVVVELYRAGWQIEPFFKRCRSLLHFDHLRAFDPHLVRTYCLAKLIGVALIQCLHVEAVSLSFWGVPRRRTPAA